jgi:mRNA interferase MazF
MIIKRGNIYLANLDPAIGSEINKTRPVIVVSNDINNQYSNTVTILPVTSNINKIYPFEVFIEKGVANLPKDSKIKADQIRTIDTSRLFKEIGTRPNTIVEQIEEALRIHLYI